MTFKHAKFEDSSTMRSLVKVATDKGWIKEEPLQKTAAVKKTADLRPTDNLMDNVLRLCAGLRERGFEKYAEELENNLFTYKQADTMYDVSKEKGEDLLEHAHPQGSHKLENIDSAEALVEDLIEQHEKDMKAVDKKPAGKLTDASAVLGAVKRVLAQSADAQSLLKGAYANAYEAYQLAAKAGNLTNMVLSWTKGRIDIINQAASKSPEELTTNDIEDAVSALNAMSRNLHPNLLHNFMPEFLNKGIADDTVWAQIDSKIQAALKLCETATNIVKSQALSPKDNTAPGGAEEGRGSGTLQMPEQQVAADPLIGKGATLINRLKGLQALRNVAYNPEALQWTKDEIGEIQDVVKRFNQALADGQGDAVRSDLEAEMNTKESEVNDFYKQVHQGA